MVCWVLFCFVLFLCVCVFCVCVMVPTFFFSKVSGLKSRFFRPEAQQTFRATWCLHLESQNPSLILFTQRHIRLSVRAGREKRLAPIWVPDTVFVSFFYITSFKPSHHSQEVGASIPISKMEKTRPDQITDPLKLTQQNISEFQGIFNIIWSSDSLSVDPGPAALAPPCQKGMFQDPTQTWGGGAQQSVFITLQ